MDSVHWTPTLFLFKRFLPVDDSGIHEKFGKRVFLRDLQIWQRPTDGRAKQITQIALPPQLLLTINRGLLRLPTGKEDISKFCSIEKASEAHEHLVQQTAAVLVSQLSLTELLQSAHLLVHHLRRLL